VRNRFAGETLACLLRKITSAISSAKYSPVLFRFFAGNKL
jgi:hypothetical protein